MNILSEKKRKACVSLLADGLTLKQVSKQLGISNNTASKIKVEEFGRERKSRKGLKLNQDWRNTKERQRTSSHYYFTDSKRLFDNFGEAF